MRLVKCFNPHFLRRADELGGINAANHAIELHCNAFEAFAGIFSLQVASDFACMHVRLSERVRERRIKTLTGASTFFALQTSFSFLRSLLIPSQQINFDFISDNLIPELLPNWLISSESIRTSHSPDKTNSPV